MAKFELKLRPATLEDAPIVADLESLRDPEEPRDPVLLRHWWQMSDELERTMRRVVARDGEAVAYVAATHEKWNEEEKRFGIVRPLRRKDVWDDGGYAQLGRLEEYCLRGVCPATAA